MLKIRNITPPTVNHMYINKIVGYGKKAKIQRFKTAQATNFILYLKIEAKKHFKACISKDNDVKLIYTLYCDKKGRIDLDNTFKAIQDSLEGIAFENDKQITEIQAKKVRHAGFNGFDLDVEIIEK